MLGLGIVLLVPWKSVIVRRAPVLRAASLTLLGLIMICVVSGLVEVFAGYGVLWRLSPIQVHVGSALLAAPLLAWHVLRHRPQRLRRTDVSRRTLLRSGALAAGAAATYLTLEGIGRLAGSASASRISTGSHLVSADAIPATIWLFDQVPDIGTDHRVLVAGSAFSVSDLASRSRAITARLDCTSGWYTDATWTAVSLADLLAAEKLSAAASIEVVSVTGYRRRFPADEAGSLWLATAYQGEPLQRRVRCTGSAGRATSAGILVGQVGGIGRAQRRACLGSVTVSVAVMPRCQSARGFGELARNRDYVYQRAVAPHGDLHPPADRVLDHPTLQLGARTQ